MLLFITLVVCGVGLIPGSCPADEPYPSELPSFDPYATPTAYTQTSDVPLASDPRWCFDILPDGLIYRPYLAGPKESRTAIQFVNTDDEWTIDSAVGGQWGVLRFGTQDPCFPQGIQLDFEASAQFRHFSHSSLDILSGDLRFGLPLTFGRNNHQTKLALYFLRTHPSGRLLERLQALRTDDFFQRQTLVLGHSVYPTSRFRLYGEVGYAFSSVVSDQWEFQFGTEYAPVCPTGLLGAPFIAANGYLREEVDYGGTFTFQAGWAWRKKRGRMFRIGLHYANGMSNQFALHDRHEQQIGLGLWHDF